jgi:hypothetical protein
MRFKSGEVQITDGDIKRFAAEFDPQPMHLDEVAAEGLAAALAQRLIFFKSGLRPTALLAISRAFYNPQLIDACSGRN